MTGKQCQAACPAAGAMLAAMAVPDLHPLDRLVLVHIAMTGGGRIALRKIADALGISVRRVRIALGALERRFLVSRLPGLGSASQIICEMAPYTPAPRAAPARHAGPAPSCADDGDAMPTKSHLIENTEETCAADAPVETPARYAAPAPHAGGEQPPPPLDGPPSPLEPSPPPIIPPTPGERARENFRVVSGSGGTAVDGRIDVEACTTSRGHGIVISMDKTGNGKRSRTRGTLLPETWKPDIDAIPQSLVDAIFELAPDDDAADKWFFAVADSFRGYWLALGDCTRARKIDWQMTFHNWLRKEIQHVRSRGFGRKAVAPQPQVEDRQQQPANRRQGMGARTERRMGAAGFGEAASALVASLR